MEITSQVKSVNEFANSENPFKKFSGMCVKVRDEQNNLMFVAILDIDKDGGASLRQLSDQVFTPPKTDGKFIKAVIRGYSERDKKAVYLEGIISKSEDNIWKIDDLKLVKILNDRAFYRVDANIDAIATSAAPGEKADTPCRMINISKGGANILSEENYAVNDKIVLKAKLRPEAEESLISCEIVRIIKRDDQDGPKYEYGCRFTSLSRIDENHIAKNILKAVEEKRK